MTRIGNCDICGKSASWSSPCVDPTKGIDHSPLWCDRCASQAVIYLVGIAQHLDEHGHRQWPKGDQTHRKRGQVVHVDQRTNTVDHAWTDNGYRTMPKELLPDLPPESTLDWMANLREEGLIACTGCNRIIPESEVAGHPLFAGTACAPCWRKHQEHLESQHKAGKVCRLCGQPYGNCCC